jgi:hypothetical protein
MTDSTIDECYFGTNTVFSDKSISCVDIVDYVKVHFTEI